MNEPIDVIAGTPIRGDNKHHVGHETAAEIVRLLREAGYLIVSETAVSEIRAKLADELSQIDQT